MHLLFHAVRPAAPGPVAAAESAIDGYCRALAARECSVALLREAAEDGAGPPLTAAETAGYVTIRARDPVAALGGLIAQSRPDCVVLATTSDLAPAMEVCRQAGVPVAVVFVSAQLGLAGVTFVEHPAYLYLAPSRFMASRVGSWFGIHAEAIAPIIEPERHLVAARGDRVLFVDPLRDRGWEIAIALAERLARFGFIVLEASPLGEAWRRHCSARAARLPHVEWHAPADDMRAVWARTRVLLMPSVWEEPIGAEASTAQASGIPVLAADRGALPEAVGPGGVVIDLHAPIDEWAASLERLMDDAAYHEAVAAAARDHAARPEIQPDQAAARLLRLLAAHVARNARGA